MSIAVPGVGEHGKKHARTLKQVPGAELAGVYDLRPERAQEMGAELGVRAFQSLDEAVPTVRAVSVVIPTTDHAAARAALEYNYSLGITAWLDPLAREDVLQAYK